MCYFPNTVTITTKRGVKQNVIIPCRKCAQCLKDKQNNWIVRFDINSHYYKNIIFFTLTYNEESVSWYNGYRVVNKKHLQDWIKRFRRHWEYTYKQRLELSYYITAEYGPNTCRPHYHGLFFTNADYVLFQSIFDDWRNRFGFVSFSLSRYQSKTAHYVSKYMYKPDFVLHPDEKDGKVLPTFRICSKGIGLQYVNAKNKLYHRAADKKLFGIVEQAKYSLSRNYYHYYDIKTHKVFKYKLPKYIKEKLLYLWTKREYQSYDPELQIYQTKYYEYPNKESLFALAIKDAIFENINDLHESQLREVLSKRQDLSRDEADHLVYLQRCDEAKSKNKESYSNLNRYYIKHTIKNKKF